MIADNKLALNAGWDEEALRVELEDLAADFGELMGFSEDELVVLLKQGEATGGPSDEARDLSDDAERFEVIIECIDEVGQESAYNYAQAGGFQCRISTF